MAVSKKVEMDMIRVRFLELVGEFLASKGEDVLRVKSNEIAIPCVGCEGNEYFLVVNFKVPTGANKGTEPYNGYELAQDYIFLCEEKAEKAKAKAKAKAEKIERDAEIRKRKAEIRKPSDEEIAEYEKEMRHAPSYLATVGKEGQ